MFKLAGTCLEYPGPLSDACFPLHYFRIRLRFDYTAFSAVCRKNKMPFLTVPSGFEPESRARRGARPRRWTTEQYRRIIAAGIFAGRFRGTRTPNNLGVGEARLPVASGIEYGRRGGSCNHDPRLWTLNQDSHVDLRANKRAVLHVLNYLMIRPTLLLLSYSPIFKMVLLSRLELES